MSFRKFLRGILATVAAYFVSLVVIMFAMSSYVTGDPNIDGRDTTLPLLNLLAKIGLAFVTAFVAGFFSEKRGWLVGALAVLVLLLAAAILPMSFFAFAFFKGDDLLFCAVYLLVGAIAGLLGNLSSKQKSKVPGSS